MSAGRQERPPQAEMVGQVASALVEPSTHLIEAPTGTGKTMAYLVTSDRVCPRIRADSDRRCAFACTAEPDPKLVAGPAAHP